MLLFFAASLAGTASDDFAVGAGSWSGGSVEDGVLRVADGRAEFTGFDPATLTSLTVTVRVRSTTTGGWSFDVGEALTASFTARSGLGFGDTRWPLPMSHLTWVPDADPVYEAFGDGWEAGGVLHAAVVHDEAAAEWRLYYTAFFGPPGYGYRQIGLATSPDGHTWTRHPENPILSIDYSDDIDGVHVHMPDVVQKPDGSWEMIYACYQNNVGNRLCWADSPDGKAWTPRGIAVDRGTTGEFDSGSLRMPAVWIDDAGLWHLWYDGTDPEQHYGPTGYATSADGITWVKAGEILDFAHSLQGLDVVETPWGLEALYNRDDYFVRASADPTSPTVWTEAGVVLTKGWSWWNDGYIQAPTLALDDTTWRMWFNGYTYTDGFERLGHATGVAEPGRWMDVTLAWDGASLTASVDGAALPAVAAPTLDGLTFVATGEAELDDVVVTWEVAPVDTGDPADTGDTDTDGAGGADTADTGETGDTGNATDGCGCASGPTTANLVAAAFAAGVARRRRGFRAGAPAS